MIVREERLKRDSFVADNSRGKYFTWKIVHVVDNSRGR
jgi:hypothetical protein